MPDDTPEMAKARKRLDEFLSRPQQGDPGYECPNHPPSKRCLSCITDDEWEAAHA